MKKFILFGILLSSTSFAATPRVHKYQPTVFVLMQIAGVNSDKIIGVDKVTQKQYQDLFEAARNRGEILNDVELRFGDDGEIRNCIDFKDGVQSYNFLHALAFSIRKDIKATGVQRTVILTGDEGCSGLDHAVEKNVHRL